MGRCALALAIAVGPSAVLAEDEQPAVGRGVEEREGETGREAERADGEVRREGEERGGEAERDEGEADEDRPNRFELAPFPSLGGNTDIGFQFGVNIAVARLAEGYSPYRFRVQGIAELSVKRGPDGVDFPQHNYLARLDLPGLAGGRFRIMPEIGFERTINVGYYGLQGLSSDDPLGRLVLGEESGRRYQFILQQPLVSVDTRYSPRRGPIDILAGFDFRYFLPDTYAESLLREDLERRYDDGTRVLVGGTRHALVLLRAGLLLDRRDHEIAPTRGTYLELAARGGIGFPTDAEVFAYAGFTLDFRVFTSLIDEQRLVFGARFLWDLGVGDVPFYELSRVGTFDRHGFCGSQGVRGSPEGRHAGRLKLLGAAELRSLFVRFRLFRMPMAFGLLTSVTVGQAWTTLSPKPPFTGAGLASTFSVGAGLLLRWGEAVMVRIEADYSPDATDGGLPVGIYFDLGYAF